jgi:hypothetical protein
VLDFGLLKTDWTPACNYINLKPDSVRSNGLCTLSTFDVAELLNFCGQLKIEWTKIVAASSNHL